MKEGFESFLPFLDKGAKAHYSGLLYENTKSKSKKKSKAAPEHISESMVLNSTVPPCPCTVPALWARYGKLPPGR